MCQLSPVAFHGDTIFCVLYDDQPYIPMRPIVENLGLDWSAQAAKFRANKDRWTVAIITTVAQDGLEREMLCIPIRKYPAWLNSLNPNKVKPELRPKIELYQAESDDVLWNHWMSGRAEGKTENPNAETVNGPLTPAARAELKALVDAKLSTYPASVQGKARGEIWSRFNRKFRIAEYAQLPMQKLDEARDYLVEMEVKALKALPPNTEALPPSGDKYEAYMVKVEAARGRINEEISRLMDDGIKLVDHRKFGSGCLMPFTYALADWLRDILTRPSPVVGSWRHADNALNYSPLGIFQKMEKDFEYLKGK